MIYFLSLLPINRYLTCSWQWLIEALVWFWNIQHLFLYVLQLLWFNWALLSGLSMEFKYRWINFTLICSICVNISKTDAFPRLIFIMLLSVEISAIAFHTHASIGLCHETVLFVTWLSHLLLFLTRMALNGLFCADVPLRTYSLFVLFVRRCSCDCYVTSVNLGAAWCCKTCQPFLSQWANSLLLCDLVIIICHSLTEKIVCHDRTHFSMWAKSRSLSRYEWPVSGNLWSMRPAHLIAIRYCQRQTV